IAKGNARQLVYYWYQSRGRVISEDWQKIVYVGLDRALQGRTDGSLIRFSVPILGNDDAAAEATFQDLASRILTLLPDYVPE
ncbi:MAG: EpsI family protein, partial [Deltaproteobacteria bacterium]|nr:EpsI family protein [Deltaproteobacteria bacterium]